jgi:Uma2 family endonuclease
MFRMRKKIIIAPRAGKEGKPMLEIAKRCATYEDLYSIPENAIGEIIEGDLYAHPRPARKHVWISSRLGSRVIHPYDFGEGGPGGWVILVEPEIGLGGNVLVPDLAGWKKDRFPREENTNWISVAPDWICEILSPSTAMVDMVRKMPIYAGHGVGHAWIVDPLAKTLGVFRNKAGAWDPIRIYEEAERVCAEPFDELELDMTELWL